jgi:hypothetical protein
MQCLYPQPNPSAPFTSLTLPQHEIDLAINRFIENRAGSVESEQGSNFLYQVVP